MVVEFALLFPVILVVFFAIIQFGFIMFTRQEMLYAARKAARSYSVGLNNADAAKQLALDLLNPSDESTITFTVTVLEPGDSPSDEDGGSGGSSDNGVTGDVTVTITVPMADAALISFLDESILSGNIEVSARMFVQDVVEVSDGSGGTGNASSSATSATSATGDASFHDYVNGGNHFV